MTPDGIPSPTELARSHRRLYDQLAPEYDARVEALRPVVTDTLERLLLPRLGRGSRCLDLGCGAGLVSELLTAAGHQVTALDLSPRMLDATATRAPEATLIEGDYLELELAPRFDAISAFAFIHLFPATDAERALQRMRRNLRRGGLLLIGTTAAAAEAEGFEAKADYPGAPARFRRHWTPQAFLDLLERSGFVILEMVRHGDPFGKDWLDVIADRP